MAPGDECMEKFSKTLRGYNPSEVNQFIDKTIAQVEKLVAASKEKDEYIKELQEQLSSVNEKLARYENMDDTMRQTILMAQKTSEQVKLNTLKESELILNDAKVNANRIVNDALLKADETEKEAERLRRNMNIYKRKLSDQLKALLDMANDIEKVDLDNK